MTNDKQRAIAWSVRRHNVPERLRDLAARHRQEPFFGCRRFFMRGVEIRQRRYRQLQLDGFKATWKELAR